MKTACYLSYLTFDMVVKPHPVATIQSPSGVYIIIISAKFNKYPPSSYRDGAVVGLLLSAWGTMVAAQEGGSCESVGTGQ